MTNVTTTIATVGSKFSVEVVAWRAFEKNTLQGFATVRLPELHLVIQDVAVHQKGLGRWVQLPAKPMLKDGALVTNRETGKIEYVKILEFDRKDVSDRFRDRVLEALDNFRAGEGLA